MLKAESKHFTIPKFSIRFNEWLDKNRVRTSHDFLLHYETVENKSTFSELSTFQKEIVLLAPQSIFWTQGTRVQNG
jgi:hypothetical protein